MFNFVVARRFKFGVEEVNVNTTLDHDEDDLLLVIASTTGTGNISSKYFMGEVRDNDSIKGNNLTQEIDVPDKAANLSVAFSAFNAPDVNEEMVGGT